MKHSISLIIVLCLHGILFSQDTTKIIPLEEVTITSLRQTEKAQEAPLSITTISGKELSQLRGNGIDEALNNVSGVIAQSRTGGQDVRIIIRGFGARGAGERSNAGTSRGIRILSDGIPETEPDGRTSFDLIDMSTASKIEILRSNVSSLWGNAAGGVINVSSIPEENHTSISLQNLTGSFGFQKNVAAFNLPIHHGKTFFSITKNTFSGWRDHSRSERTAFNGGIVSALDEKTRLGIFLLGTKSFFQIAGPITKSQYNTTPQQANTTYSPNYIERDERRNNTLGRLGFTIEHQFNQQHEISAMTYVNPKFLQRSERNTWRDFTRYHVGGNFIYRNTQQFTPSLHNKFIVGVDEAYQDGAVLFYSLQNGERGTTLRDNKREGANNFGTFFQNELSIQEKFNIVAGGRYDNITYYYESFVNSNLSDKKSFTHFTPKLGLSYRMSPLQTLYSSISGGVEVPAGNETDPPSTFGEDTVYAINPLLQPILSSTIEVGTKHILLFDEPFIRSFNYDIAVYFIQTKNDIIPYRDGRFYFTAGKTNRTGIEVSGNAETFRNLFLQTSFTYSKNLYKEYRIDSVHYNANAAGKFIDLSGNLIAGIPEFSYFLGMKYQFPFQLSVDVNVRGMGSYYADDANTISIPSYSIISTSIGYEQTLVKNLSLKTFLTINNLIDEKYISSVYINPQIPANGEPAYIEPGLPRTITFGISLQWGDK